MATQFSKLSRKYTKVRKINNMQIQYKNLNLYKDIKALILKYDASRVTKKKKKI